MTDTPTNEAVQPGESKDSATGVPSLNSALGALQQELTNFRDSAEHFEESRKAVRQAATAASEVIQRANSLVEPAAELAERIGKIDFPSRLDKLDATVASLMLGLQQTQARIEGIERSLQDDIRGMWSQMLESNQRLDETLESGFSRVEALSASSQESARRRFWVVLSILIAVVALIVFQILQ